MSLKDRITKFIEYKDISRSTFEKSCGLSNAYTRNIKENIGSAKLEQILNAYPELNRVWLLTGEGAMLRYPESNASPVGGAVQVISESLTPVRFFEVTPTASFQEFCVGVSERPSSIGVQPEHGEDLDDSYCVFEIHGESMAPQIQPNAKVLCREIPPTKWHMLKEGVVAIAYADKFVIKRIIKNAIDSNGYVILGSDNPAFVGTATVQLSDIRAIFQAKRIISSQIF